MTFLPLSTYQQLSGCDGQIFHISRVVELTKRKEGKILQQHIQTTYYPSQILTIWQEDLREATTGEEGRPVDKETSQLPPTHLTVDPGFIWVAPTDITCGQVD